MSSGVLLDQIGEWIGQALGWAARNIGAIWQAIWRQIQAFFDGFARGLGVDQPSPLGWLLILIGILFLFSAYKRIKQKRWVSLAIRATLGLLIIGFAIGGV